MCVVSATHDYMMKRTKYEDWTRPAFNEYAEIIRRLGELDKKLGQPDCVDPAKDAWMRDIDERLRKLEAASNV